MFMEKHLLFDENKLFSKENVVRDFGKSQLAFSHTAKKEF